MEISEIRKTRNWFRCIGVCNEKNLKQEDCEVKLYEDGKLTGEKVKAECIKGSVSVRVASGIITFPVYFASTGMDGKESRNWKMAKAMMDKWEPQINGTGEEPTLVAIEGAIEPNDYVSQNGEAKYNLRYRVRSANTRVQPDEAHGMTISGIAFIGNIKHEMRNEEETGRLVVDLYGVNNKGAIYPIPTLVEEELADDFEDNYEAGQTVNFDIDVVVHHVGGQTSGKKKAFGRGGSVSVNSGFDVTELMIVGADDPIEEPDELTYEDEEGNIKEVKTDWLNPKAMAKAKKVREAMLEEMAKAGPAEKASGGHKSIKEMKQERKMAKTATKPPFDMDDGFEDDDF